jgi:FkbM family methyltransferase
MNPQDQVYIDSVQEQINSGMYDKFFMSKSYDEASWYPKKDLVLLDIGANIGLVSSYAIPYCKRIVAVEPSSRTFDMLFNRTYEFKNITRVHVALSDSTGTHEFFENDLNFTASSTVNTYGTRTIVPCTTLTNLLRDYNLDHVDICKVDIEGAEDEALNFGELEYAKNIIDQWFIETHNCPKTTWEHKLGTIVGNLARCGYSKISINGMAITASK